VPSRDIRNIMGMKKADCPELKKLGNVKARVAISGDHAEKEMVGLFSLRKIVVRLRGNTEWVKTEVNRALERAGSNPRRVPS